MKNLRTIAIMASCGGDLPTDISVFRGPARLREDGTASSVDLHRCKWIATRRFAPPHASILDLCKTVVASYGTPEAPIVEWQRQEGA